MKTVKKKKISGFQGLGVGERMDRPQKVFLGQYDIMMIDTCHYTFVKIHRIHKNKSES